MFKNNKKKDLLGLYLDNDYIRMVHVEINGSKREVKRVSCHEIRGMSDEDISNYISAAMVTWKLPSPNTYLLAPPNLAITRNIEIPSRNPEEIRNIIYLQAHRRTAFARSEIAVDTLMVDVFKESYTKVFMAIIQKEPLIRQLKILDKTPVLAQKVLFSAEGICRAVHQMIGASIDVVIAIVHMDHAFTSFMVMRAGMIIFYRGFPIGANQYFEEKENYQEQLASEFKKSIDTYVADKAGPLLKSVVLAAGSSQPNELDDLITSSFNLPVRRLAYTDHIQISKQTKADVLASPNVSYFDLIGPLLLFDLVRLNLMPEEKRMKLQMEKSGQDALKTAVLVVIILAVVLAGFMSKFVMKQIYLNRLVARYQPVKEEAKSLEGAFERSQVVKKYLASRGNSLETLSELCSNIPREVKLTQIHYEENSKFVIKGSSSKTGEIFLFITSLEKSKKFKNVKTKYVTSRKEGEVDYSDFEINCTFES